MKLRFSLLFVILLLVLVSTASAQMLESFEYGVPPPGWIKTNLYGGSGWSQLPIGTFPLPSWGNGTSSVPPTAAAGTHDAYVTWNTGGGPAGGYHNDQWLISPRLTGLTATSTVSYWLRFCFTNYPDAVYFRVSTTGPNPADFTIVAQTNIFAKASGTSQFHPWSNHVVNVGALGIPAGTPIWVAIEEFVWDSTWSGAAVELDVISSDLTAPPEPRLNTGSLTFTAYYDGPNPADQTFTIQSVGSSGMSFVNQLIYDGEATNWLTLSSPPSGTIPFQNSLVTTASVSVAGLDPGVYTATQVISIPGAANSPLRVAIKLNVIRRPQTIAFPDPGPQYTTNILGLVGTASSGLPVTFSVYKGPGVVAGVTNLTFTGTGTVKVVCWQLGNIYYDVAPCVTNSILVTKSRATISLADMSHVYDGSPHGATVTTVPPGLSVETTYNGSTTLPVNIGSYAVTSTVNDVIYEGTEAGTFTITRMVQSISFPDPGPQLATNRVGLAATANSGLPVSFSAASGPGGITDGTNLTFIGAGTVSVVASHPGDADWLPASATNWIVVTKATAPVTLNDLSQQYDGTPRIVTATTVPAGLTVDITYAGSGTAPTAAGSYAVTGTVNEVMYQGVAAGTVTVDKANQAIAFPALQPRLTNAVVDMYAGASSGLPVTEFSVVAGPGVINGTNLTFTGVGDVLVAAVQSGDGNWNPAPAVTNLVKAFTVNPPSAPAAGGATVVITNGLIGDGASITNVTLCGVTAMILGQGTNWVGVQCGAGTAGTGDIVIQSDTDVVVSNAFTYNPAGTIFVVGPDIGSYMGGYPVTITGTNLCDGDVTNVTLCGVAAALVSQSQTQVVVVAGAGSPGTGDVRVCSVSFGDTAKSNAFTYALAKMSALGTGGAAIASDDPADIAKGTDFGSRLVLGTYTNWFTITNSGDAALTILSVITNGSSAFSAHDLPPGVLPGASISFSIAYSPVGVGMHSGALWLANDSTTSPYRINLAGTSMKRDQAPLTFTPASPQRYLTTNELSVTGGSGTGDVTYAIVSGPGVIAGGTGLWMSTGSGSVLVRATKAGDDLYNEQSVTGVVAAARADQVIGFAPLGSQVATNCIGLQAVASSGLPVVFSIASGPALITGGTNLSFAGVGAVVLTVTQAGDANWNPAPVATNMFAVTTAPASVTLKCLEQSYDSTPRVVTADTAPAGLPVVITYDGSSSPPVGAGTYEVVGIIDHALYGGGATGTLSIAKAVQTIEFPPIAHQSVTNIVHLIATASSGLPVTFSVQRGSALITDGTNLVISAAGMITVRAVQAGNANWSPCQADVTFGAGLGVPLDFDGDGKSDVAVYWPAGGNWYIRYSGGGSTNVNWGWSAAVPVPADYDGDGKSDIAVYWPAGGNWYIKYSDGGSTNFSWGWSAAVAVPSDYDGDGKSDIAVYWPAGGNWYIRYSGGGSTVKNFGWSAAVPVPGDYDGDGTSDIAVYWPGGITWYLTYSSGGSTSVNWGWSVADPVPADYDGDGKTDIGVYWPGDGNWYIRYISGGSIVQQFGWNAAVPVTGDYDGDGKLDIAVYWAAGGTWYLRYSGGGSTNFNWGWSEAQPVLPQHQINKSMGLLP